MCHHTPNEQPAILIADDDESILRSMARVLSFKYKNNIFTTVNIPDTLAVIRSRPLDLVFLDIHFGDEQQTGIDCVRQARAAGYGGIICMLTADQHPTALFQAALAGANDYIVKGSAHDLSDEVVRLLQLHEEDEPSGQSYDPILDSAFLRSRKLSKNQVVLLSDFAKFGYPRIKEFARQLHISETSLWKRLSRIREKLGADAMTQITYILTAIKIFEGQHTAINDRHSSR